MDNRFPNWLKVVLRKLDFIGLPNIGMFVCGLSILGFFGLNFLGAPLERFIFDPYLVQQGEWWRLLSFPTGDGITNPIWFIFYVLYIYFVMSQMEAHWGPGPLTVFTFFAYWCAIGASFVAGRPLSIWYHVVENLSLAFGTLFPNLELYLFFIIPVKAKWLAVFAGVLLLFQFIVGGWIEKAFLIIVLLPYLTFFGPSLVTEGKAIYRRRKNRGRMDDWRN